VQRGLPVEDHDVAVDQVTVDLPVGFDLLGEFLAVLLGHLQPSTVGTTDVVGAGMGLGAVPDVLTRLLDVCAR